MNNDQLTGSSTNELAPLVYRPPRPAVLQDNRSNLRRQLAVLAILVGCFFERLAFYSLAGNLVVFLSSTDSNWKQFNAVTASFIFLGTSYISALITAWLSDAKLGRAKTIILGYIFYCLGYCVFPLFARGKIRQFCPYVSLKHDNIFQEPCSYVLLPTLIFIGLGVGAVQANTAVFGAEQVQNLGAAETSAYFNKYYAAVNFGGLLAFGVIAYVQQNVDFFYGYVIPATLLIIAALLFIGAYPLYIHSQPFDSVITLFIPVLINAFRSKRQHSREVVQQPQQISADENSVLTQQFDCRLTSTEKITFIDYARASKGGKFIDRIVDDVKSLRYIIVVFVLLIPYWLIYFQIETTFLVQGLHMRIPRFGASQRMPAIWLSLGDQVIIILMILFLNTVIYKRLNSSGRAIKIETRIVIGMVCATLAMCASGLIEIFRVQTCQNYPTVTQIIGNTTYIAADFTIFAQFPQYIAVGLSEVFASVASLEFAYLSAPRSAQSLIMALRFCSSGISSFLGSGYVNLFIKIAPSFDIQPYECKTKQPIYFYMYFYILAALQILFIFIFLFFNKKFHILKIVPQRFSSRLFSCTDSGSTKA